MLVDTAAMLLLSSGLAGSQPALRQQAAVQMQANGAGAQLLHMPQVYNNPQNAALLMGPFPVLATMMRESLQQTAAAYVQGATNLLDLSMSDDDAAMSEVSDAEMPPLDEQSISSTAMVGATAAAIALLNLRGGAHG